MSPEPPLWQQIDAREDDTTYARLERNPTSGRLELTLADADDVELTLTMNRAEVFMLLNALEGVT